MDAWEHFKMNNKELWHFDPSKKEVNYTLIARLKTDFSNLLELIKDDTVFAKVVLTNPVETDNPDILNRIESFRKWGYNEYNSLTYQLYDYQFPEIFSKYTALTYLMNPSAFLLKQNPGQAVPWHYDTFFSYMKNNDLADDKAICRYLIFLEDWQWGHYVFCGNSVIHQWVKGDVIYIPYRMHHASCNVGMVPLLTLLVTGITTDTALHISPQLL